MIPSEGYYSSFNGENSDWRSRNPPELYKVESHDAQWGICGLRLPGLQDPVCALLLHAQVEPLLE